MVGQGVLLLSGSRLVDKSIRYYYDAFDAATGEELWHADHDSGLPIDGGHGEYNRHPTIVGDIVYAWPYAYMLRTGERIESWKFERRGHGCGGISASAQCLFWRGGNPWMYDLGPSGGPMRLNSVSRPGLLDQHDRGRRIVADPGGKLRLHVRFPAADVARLYSREQSGMISVSWW